MAATVTSKLIVQLNSYLANTLGLASGQANIERGISYALASGVAADQSDRIYSELAKSISGNYDLDLSGTLVDAFGAACVFARVKVLVVIAAAANTGNVIIGNGATPFVGPFGAAAHTVAVRPGGCVVFFAPDATAWPVTAATADILRFAPSAGTQVFDFAVLGASA